MAPFLIIITLKQPETMIYEISYPDFNVVQLKKLIPASVVAEYDAMPSDTKEEQSIAKSWLKRYTGGMEWFTDDSPLFKAISTGTLKANGEHKVTFKTT